MGEQLHRKCVAEAVRVGVNAGSFTHRRNRSPQSLGACLPVTISRPKEVLVVPARRRQVAQRLGRLIVEQKLQRDTVLCDAQQQVTVLERCPGELGHVGDAQSGVEQGEEQRSGSLANMRSIGTSFGSQALTGKQHGADVGLRVRHHGTVLHDRGLNELRGIPGGPFPDNAEGKEAPQILDLLSLGARRHLPPAAKPAHVLGTHLVKRQVLHGGLEKMSEGAGDTAEARFLEVAVAGIFKVCLDRLLCRPRRLTGAEVLIFAAFESPDPAKGKRHVGSGEGPAKPFSLQLSICPDRTGAEGVVPALIFVLAAIKVPAVSGQGHAGDSIRFVTQVCRVKLSLAQVLYFVTVGLVRKVGIEPLSPVFRPQLVDSSSASCSLFSTNRLLCHVCDKPFGRVAA